jgi:hypothetical protein
MYSLSPALPITDHTVATRVSGPGRPNRQVCVPHKKVEGKDILGAHIASGDKANKHMREVQAEHVHRLKRPH